MKFLLFILLCLPLDIDAQQKEHIKSCQVADTLIIIDPVANNPKTRQTEKNTYEITKADGSKETFIHVDKMPKPDYNINEYLGKHLSAKEDEYICSRLVVGFTIEANGNISNTHIIQPCNNSLDSSVLNAIAKMPPWQPAILNGKPVASPYTLPIIVDIE